MTKYRPEQSHPRLSPKDRLSVHIYGASDEPAAGLLVNVSEGGAMIETSGVFDKGMRVLLRIAFDPEEPFSASGEVVWRRGRAHGVVFCIEDPEQRARLRTLLDEVVSYGFPPGGSLFQKGFGRRKESRASIYNVAPKMDGQRTYRIKQYPLELGALEIQYIEEFFGEFARKKTAKEIQDRLAGRPHVIQMAEARLPEDPSQLVPVSYKVGHEIFAEETDPKLKDLVKRLEGAVDFSGRRILYSWIGGTRSDWRGQGHFRALTEQQEAWALEEGFKELVVKTKNKFYGMRGTLTHLNFDVVKYERDPLDNRESKVYLSKRIGPEVLQSHQSERKLVQAM